MIDKEKWAALNPWAFWAAYRIKAVNCLPNCYLCSDAAVRGMQETTQSETCKRAD